MGYDGLVEKMEKEKGGGTSLRLIDLICGQ